MGSTGERTPLTFVSISLDYFWSVFAVFIGVSDMHSMVLFHRAILMCLMWKADQAIFGTVPIGERIYFEDFLENFPT